MSLVKIEDNDVHTLLINGTTYFDILLYNCYDEINRQINKDKLSQAFDDLLDIYSNLFNLGLSISGYQFIGIILEKNLSLTETIYIRIAYFLLSVGFLISMFGVLLSFITIKYLRGCREENPEFIIVGINKYKTLFQLSNIILYVDCAIFTIPINILIYNGLDYYFAIIYNTFCFILFISGIYFHYNIIISKQAYNITNNDISHANSFNSDIFEKLTNYVWGNTEYKYERNIFKQKNN